MKVELDDTPRDEEQPDGTPSEEEQVDLNGEINSLLSDNPDEEPESEEPEEDNPPKEPAEEALIDDAIIAKYPELKPYKGKPLVSLADYYGALREDYRKKSNELKQLTNKGDKAEIDQVLSEMPDIYENPKEFKAWMGKAFKVLKEEGKKEALNEINPKLTTFEEDYSDRQAEVIQDAIESNLPEGITFQQAMDNFKATKPNDATLKFYNDNPGLFVQHVLQAEQLKAYEADKNLSDKEREKKAKKLAAEKIRNGIRAGNEIENEGGRFNATTREPEELSEADKLLLQINQNLGE